MVSPVPGSAPALCRPHRHAHLAGQRHEPDPEPGLGANDYILKTTPPPCCWPGCGSSSASRGNRPRSPWSPARRPSACSSAGCRSTDRAGTCASTATAFRSPPPILISCGARLPPARSWGGGAVSQPAWSRLRRPGSQHGRGHLPPAPQAGDDTSNPTRIKTVRQKGYLLVPQAWE